MNTWWGNNSIKSRVLIILQTVSMSYFMTVEEYKLQRKES